MTIFLAFLCGMATVALFSYFVFRVISKKHRRELSYLHHPNDLGVYDD